MGAAVYKKQNTCAEQSLKTLLEKSRLGKAYVEVLETYIEQEKDKFEVAACVALMEPENRPRFGSSRNK